MKTKKESSNIVNFINSLPLTWPYNENANICYSLFVYIEAWIRKIRYIVMITKDGIINIANVFTPAAGILM